MTLISVVIPVLDDAPMLRVCLAALATQSRPADEIIVVDNGSVDDSAEVARRAGALVVRSTAAGIPAATATGFDEASGDILARLDADSVPPMDWIERIEAALEDPGLTAITGPGRFYGGSSIGNWIGRRVYLGGYFHLVGWALGRPPLFGSNYAIRRRAWAIVRGSVHRDQADVHDDLDLSYQLTPDMRVDFDPALVVEVSARPFASMGAIAHRLHLAYTTILVNERRRSSWRRRAEQRAALRTRDESAVEQRPAIPR